MDNKYNIKKGWREKPLKAEVFVCVCGNRYIKTRKNQTVCLRCLFMPGEKSAGGKER
ncbi:MAG: hypothetical protein HYT43_01855 [Candidatus Taylorbacteria bacterium]|nr:hypothetical protein [Candidatus Taylorbacteria bacterium]